jgi:hypothetical protein
MRKERLRHDVTASFSQRGKEKEEERGKRSRFQTGIIEMYNRGQKKIIDRPRGTTYLPRDNQELKSCQLIVIHRLTYLGRCKILIWNEVRIII